MRSCSRLPLRGIVRASSPPSIPAGPTKLFTIRATLAQGTCGHDQRCYPESFAQTWDNPAQCEARRTVACELTAESPHSAYDESAIRACTPPFYSPCPGDPAYPERAAAFGLECPQPIKGLVPEGGVCSMSAECRSGWCSLSITASDTEECGVCLPIPCGGVCPPDQVCVLDPQVGSRCVRRLADDGESCEKPADCAHYFSLRARGLPAIFQKRRSMRGIPGEGPSCEGGTFCNRDTGRCEAFTFAHAQEPCGLIDGHVVLCGGASSCRVRTRRSAFPLSPTASSAIPRKRSAASRPLAASPDTAGFVRRAVLEGQGARVNRTR